MNKTKQNKHTQRILMLRTYGGVTFALHCIENGFFIIKIENLHRCVVLCSFVRNVFVGIFLHSSAVEKSNINKIEKNDREWPKESTTKTTAKSNQNSLLFHIHTQYHSLSLSLMFYFPCCEYIVVPDPISISVGRTKRSYSVL